MVQYVGGETERFDELMKVFLHSEYRVSQRASWVVTHCAEAFPWLISPYLPQLLAYLQQNEVSETVVRNTVRLLQFVEIPETLHGPVTDLCFGYLTKSDVPAAVKAFSITVLERLTHLYPDLREELVLILEDQLPYQSPAFVSRAKKVLGRK